MRPHELTIEGFRSYRERTVFDLRGRRLIGVVGPIGSGKSSMLDAVTFALYGKTPAAGARSRSLIHQLADAARVGLTFEVDGQVWRVQRAIRRKGQSQHKLERLDDAGEPIETVVQEQPTNQRIVELLGLEFGAFCRSVMLAQNRFAEFLKATPTQRNEVLKGVFGYERFDRALSLTRERLAASAATIAAIEDEARRLLDAKASLAEAREVLGVAAERVARFDARWADVQAATAAIEEGVRGATAADERRASIEAISSGLPDPDDLVAAATAVDAADEALAAAAEAVAVAERETAEAEAARDAVAASAAEHLAFRELVATLDERAAARAAAEGRLDTASAAAVTATRAAEEALGVSAAAGETAEDARRGAADAEAARDAAAVAVHVARHDVMAIELRRHLHEGDPCPVCAQPVAALPPAAEAPALSAAEAAHDDAMTAAARAAEVASSAAADAATAVARAEAAASTAEAAASAEAAARDDLTETDAALAVTRSELVDRLGDGDPRSLLEERERELREADELLRRTRAATATAREALEDERRAGVAAADALRRLAGALTNAWGRLGEQADVAAAPAEVRRALDDITRIVDERRREAGEQAALARERVAEAERTLAVERDALGLGLDEDPAEARSAARAAAAAAAQHVATLEERIEAAADLDERLGRAEAERDLTSRLAADLQPSRLLAFLLEEERAALAELGSVHLEELTASAYRFADDDSFAIADQHAGGATRLPESLSGGETFLASLALALALAEMVARGGGRLDAFFLDEGFGSLDPEHLDRAMDGIERLVAGGEGRLVVVVSHVEQMRLRIEDLIELDKDPRTGDSVVVRDGAATG